MTGTIGFVPTMGALHEAHLSLIKRSVDENDTTVVSIYVNPTQFNDPKDLERYPRPIEKDLAMCENAGVSYVFHPISEEMYNENEILLATPGYLDGILEGRCRPGHFNGVLRVVLKLLNIVQPNRLYLGRKDAQQLAVIEKMVDDFFINVDVIPCDLVRDPDGLAMSSRNVHLSSTERLQALCLSKSLFEVKRLVESGERNLKKLKSLMTQMIGEDIKLEYAELLKMDFSEINEIEVNGSIALIAAFVGKTRLIDNVLL